MPSFFLMIRPPTTPTLFPYPTLFRSRQTPRRSPQSPASPESGPGAAGKCLEGPDRKSTRLNSSHGYISYALFFFNDPATNDTYSLSLPDALPISADSSTITTVASFPGVGTGGGGKVPGGTRSEEHTSELQSRLHLLCPLFF